MSTIETRPFWPYSYFLWTVVHRNTGICVLFLQLTSVGAPAKQYVRPFLEFFPFSAIVADVSSQFSTPTAIKHDRFGRALNRNTFWPSNPFSAMVADVSSQFPTSQLYNMIVLAVRLIGTLFRRQIVPSMHAKMVRRTHWALRWIISNFKNSYQPENAKTKNWCHRHLNIVSNSINIRS